MMPINRNVAWQVGYALMLYMYNRRPDEILGALFDDAEGLHPNYANEWLDRIRSGNFGRLFGKLDFKRQQRLIDAALVAYEDEAQEAFVRALRYHEDHDEREALRDAGRGHLVKP